MKDHNARKTAVLLTALGLAVLLSGCGTLPDIEDAKTISLSTAYGAPWVPEVDVDGDPSLRPGAMAMGGLEAATACDYLFIFCAAVTVPISAVTGAVITATETLPEEEAELLNRLTEKAAAGLHMPRMFQSVMLSEAIRQGVDIQASGADATVKFLATHLWWEVSIGNQVSLRLTVEAHATHAGEFGRRRFVYSGKPAPVEEWLAGGDQRIRGALEAFMPEASAAIWQRILDLD